MAGPAVRVGDQTAHGGVVTGPGCPTVLINGKPAARMGDMQACPMVSGTVPHGATPIMMGVPNVLIGGVPAATVGDMFGPPCAGTVLVGSPNVLIGTSPPASVIITPSQQAARSAKAAAAAAEATAAKGSKDKDKAKKQAEETKSWIEIELQDSDGEAVANERYKVACADGSIRQGVLDGNGQARIEGIKPGQCKISFPDLDQSAWSLSGQETYAAGVSGRDTKNDKQPKFSNLRWSTQQAKVGESVSLLADAANVPDNETVEVRIYEKDKTGGDDFVESLEAKVKGGKIEAEWTFEYHADEDDSNSQQEKADKGYTKPEYVFKIIKNDAISAMSPEINFADWIELNFQLEMPYEPGIYAVITFANGRQEKREIPENGMLRMENVPPGEVEVEIEDFSLKNQ